MYDVWVMSSRKPTDRPVSISVGFAASDGGSGVAYATLRKADGTSGSLVRVGFRCRPLSALHGRDVAYQALIAVAKDALRRELGCIEMRVGDGEIALDIERRRSVPQALMIPYVVLRCALNRFREARVIAVEDETVRDLTARARAEVSLGVAA
jgi:hypothetical protein